MDSNVFVAVIWDFKKNDDRQVIVDCPPVICTQGGSIVCQKGNLNIGIRCFFKPHGARLVPCTSPQLGA